MTLQVRRAGLNEYGTFLKILMAGEPGVGKTRIASTFPNVLYANAEGGMMSVVDRAPAFVDIRSSVDLNELRLNLELPAERREAVFGCPVDTVCIDTLDEMQRILIRERLDETKKESLAIQDYGWLGDQVRGIVRAFRNLELNVIFNVHLKSDKDEETGRTFIKAQLVGAMADELAGYMDMTLLLKVTQTTKAVNGQSQRVEQRFMQTSSDSNHTWIKDRSGKLPKPEFEIDLDNDYERIIGWIRAGDIAPSVELGLLQGNRSTPMVKAPPKVSVAVKKAAVAKAPAPTPAAAPPPPPSAPEASAVDEQQSLPEPEVMPEPVVEPKAETNGSTNGHVEPAGPVLCQVCGDAVDEDQADLSKIRFREILCRTDFVARKASKKS